MEKCVTYILILLVVAGSVMPVRSQATTTVGSCLNGYRMLSPSTELDRFLKLWIEPSDEVVQVSSIQPFGRLVFKGPGNDDSSNKPTSRYQSFEFKTASLNKIGERVAVKFSTRVVDGDSFTFTGECRQGAIRGKLSKLTNAKQVWSQRVTFKEEWIVE